MATPSLFDQQTVAAWQQLAREDELVLRNTVLADLSLGLRNSQTGEQVWWSIREQGIEAGLGERPLVFWLEGDGSAFDDLARGFPFNRLVRQHRLTVCGDLRSAVQNWMLLYALTRLTKELER